MALPLRKRESGMARDFRGELAPCSAMILAVVGATLSELGAPEGAASSAQEEVRQTAAC
jgi:hypothetical protein